MTQQIETAVPSTSPYYDNKELLIDESGNFYYIVNSTTNAIKPLSNLFDDCAAKSTYSSVYEQFVSNVFHVVRTVCAHNYDFNIDGIDSIFNDFADYYGTELQSIETDALIASQEACESLYGEI